MEPIKYADREIREFTGNWAIFSLRAVMRLWNFGELENNSILSWDQIMNQSQKTNNTRLASRKELVVTWLLAPLTLSGNILNVKNWVVFGSKSTLTVVLVVGDDCSTAARPGFRFFYWSCPVSTSAQPVSAATRKTNTFIMRPQSSPVQPAQPNTRISPPHPSQVGSFQVN